MSATIVSFAQFQETRQRRRSAGPVSSAQALATPDVDSPDDRPLTITCEVPAPSAHDPAPLPHRP